MIVLKNLVIFQSSLMPFPHQEVYSVSVYVVFLFLCISSMFRYSCKRYGVMTTASETEIVLAHFREDLSWLARKRYEWKGGWGGGGYPGCPWIRNPDAGFVSYILDWCKFSMTFSLRLVAMVHFEETMRWLWISVRDTANRSQFTSKRPEYDHIEKNQTNSSKKHRNTHSYW